MNAKRKGSRNERRSIRLLEASGYACTRSAASLGAFDVIANGAADIVLLQVKSNRWPDEAEIEAMHLFAAPPNCRPLVHRWRDRARLPDVREIRAA